MDRTLVIVKPDGVERGLAGEVLGRLERKKLRLVAAELRTITKEVAETHYAEHAERPFFADLVAFITRSPALIMVVEGPKDTFAVVRLMMGTTNPAEAAPGTIRGDLAIETTENLVHGSDSHESAAREIALFFPELVRLVGPRLGTGQRRCNRRRIAVAASALWTPSESHSLWAHQDGYRPSPAPIRNPSGELQLWPKIAFPSLVVTWLSTSEPPTRWSTSAAAASC